MATKGKWKREYRQVVSDKGIICNIPLSTAIDGKEREANAHLIASAPDMYEALKKVFARQVIENGRVVERGMPSAEEVLEIGEALAKIGGN